MRISLKSFVMFALLIGVASIYLHQLRLLRKEYLYSDYGKFYQSLRFTIAGKNPYTVLYYKEKPTPTAPQPVTHTLGGNLNPPFFNLLLLPLGFLSYSVSFYVWQTISVLCGFLSVLLLKKALDLTAADPVFFTLSVLTALFIYYPTYANVWLGQVALITLALLTGALLAAQRQRERTLGLLLALLTSIKLFFGLYVIYLLVRREWRALCWFTLALVGTNAVPLVVYGSTIYTNYHRVLAQIGWYASNWNASFYGLCLRFFDATEQNVPIWPAPHLATLLYYATSSLLLLAVVKTLWPQRPLTAADCINFDFSIIIVASLLISPLGWLYYFPYLLIPFMYLLKLAEAGHYPFALRILVCASVILTSLPYYLKPPPLISERSFILGWATAYPVGLLLLVCLLVFSKIYLAKLPTTTADTCSRALAVTLYVCALLPSAAGLLASAHPFNTGHASTSATMARE